MLRPAYVVCCEKCRHAQPETNPAPDANLKAFLASLRLPEDGSYSFREGVIEDGERVSVLGCVTREVRPDGSRAHLRAPPEVLVMHGTEADPLLITDAPSVAGRNGARS